MSQYVPRHEIERFVSNLAAAFGRRMSREQAEIYASKLEKMQVKRNVSIDQFYIALSRIVANEDSFPSLATIFSYFAGAKTFDQMEVQWQTWKDSEGKWQAKKLGVIHRQPTSEEMYKQWAKEKATPEEAREAFSKGFLEAGGDPSKLGAYFGLMREPAPVRLLPPAEDEVPF